MDGLESKGSVWGGIAGGGGGGGEGVALRKGIFLPWLDCTEKISSEFHTCTVMPNINLPSPAALTCRRGRSHGLLLITSSTQLNRSHRFVCEIISYGLVTRSNLSPVCNSSPPCMIKCFLKGLTFVFVASFFQVGVFRLEFFKALMRSQVQPHSTPPSKWVMFCCEETFKKKKTSANNTLTLYG